MTRIPAPSRFSPPLTHVPAAATALPHVSATPHVSPQSAPVMRRYEVRYLDQTGQIAHHAVVAPATPMFEASCSAFARGTVLKTRLGPCAIEDLDPGTEVDTAEHGPLPVLWRGAMNVLPNMPRDYVGDQRLMRVMAGAFGPLRPENDLVLGPAAQMQRPCPATSGGLGHRLQPVTELINGDSVFQTTPPSTVQVYHICLPRQASVTANGLQFASHHPGDTLQRRLGPNMAKLYLTLFPHLNDFKGFGPSLQEGATRAQQADLDWV